MSYSMLGANAIGHALALYPGLLDALRLAIFGLILDRVRRILQTLWVTATRGLELTVRVDNSDDSYDWLHQYISTHCMTPDQTQTSQSSSIAQILLEEIWPTGRVPPRDVQVRVMKKRNQRPWEEDEAPSDSMGSIKADIFPSLGTSHSLRYKGYIIRFTLSDQSGEWGQKKNWIAMSARFAPHSLFTDLIATAQEEFNIQDHGKLRVFTPRTQHGPANWRKTVTRPHRPWESVILPGGVKEDILQDAREFLLEEDFYRERGVPYRRGYLFYGSPGAGKSSLIAAIAAELKVDVYIVNISTKQLDDAQLSQLLHGVPPRAILLMEDIDCAFPDRAAKSTPAADTDEAKMAALKEEGPPSGGVTLSGLLNALDGVASSEGRLLFCTTNHVQKIDAALSRPGRCDTWIEFTHATKTQMSELFVHFYRQRKAISLALDGERASAMPKSATTKPIDEKASIRTSNAPKSIAPPTHLDLAILAQRFAETIPDLAVSVSAIQGYLMRHKRDPESAVRDAEGWVKAGYPQGPGRNGSTSEAPVSVGGKEEEPNATQAGTVDAEAQK